MEDRGDTEDMAKVAPADDSFDTENTEVESGSTEEVRGEDMDLGGCLWIFVQPWGLPSQAGGPQYSRHGYPAGPPLTS